MYYLYLRVCVCMCLYRCGSKINSIIHVSGDILSLLFFVIQVCGEYNSYSLFLFLSPCLALVGIRPHRCYYWTQNMWHVGIPGYAYFLLEHVFVVLPVLSLICVIAVVCV